MAALLLSPSFPFGTIKEGRPPPPPSSITRRNHYGKASIREGVKKLVADMSVDCPQLSIFFILFFKEKKMQNVLKRKYIFVKNLVFKNLGF